MKVNQMEDIDLYQSCSFVSNFVLLCIPLSKTEQYMLHQDT